MSKGIVLRLGGNALFPRSAASPSIDVLDSVVRFCEMATAGGLKVVVVPGGIGGQLLTEWGRAAGASEATLSSFGRSLIDGVAMMLADHMRGKPTEFSSSPIAATARRDLQLLLDTYDVVSCGVALDGALTSDSLALLVAELLGFTTLSIKSALPFLVDAEESGPDAELYRVDLDKVTRSVLSGPGIDRAGWHPSLDVWALRILARGGTSLTITTPAGLASASSVDSLSPRLEIAA